MSKLFDKIALTVSGIGFIATFVWCMIMIYGCTITIQNNSDKNDSLVDQSISLDDYD